MATREAPCGRAFALVAAATLAGATGTSCRRSPAAPWIERDALGSRMHATTGPVGPAAPNGSSAIDARRLTAEQIDGLDEAALGSAFRGLGGVAPAGRLALRAARVAWHRGDAAAARAWIAAASDAADRGEVAAQLDALAGQIASPPIDRATIAVLLPLTGRFARIGSEFKLAIQLAPALGATWLFLDTRGDPDGAIAAVEQAARRGAIAILGPVGDRESIAAARAAAMHAIPIALLAPADGADPRGGVFRAVGSPADEARAIAQLAADDGFPTVGVFAPRDDVGQLAADAFVAEAQRLGLAVTKIGSYDPTGGDLEADVKVFLELDPSRNPRFAEHLARRGKKAWTTFSPDVPYSLLYVPDRHDRAALVAAFLPYFGVELRTSEFPDPARLARKHAGTIPQVVQLIGGAGWHHPSLPIRGGSAVQGALIVDVFAVEHGGDVGAAFAAAFQQRANRPPSGAAAEVYDAARLLAQVRAATPDGPDPRATFRDALARGKLDDGACGPTMMAKDGELTREPIVLEVEGDHFIAAP